MANISLLRSKNITFAVANISNPENQKTYVIVILVGGHHIVGVKSQGKTINPEKQKTYVIVISVGGHHIVGVKSQGKTTNLEK